MAIGVPGLLQDIYDAYREKRLADLLAYLSEDFRYIVHVPEPLVPGGDKPRTKAEAAELIQHFMDTYDFLSFDPGPIIITDHRATAQPHVRYRHKPTGKLLDIKFSHVWQVDDGKVGALEEHHDLPRLEAFLKSLDDASG